ncbi:MAG: hypothetical protein PHS93_07765 [Candidatus Omnitrophica bacterium]|nr:hypothetical protein [Candidatus Omnitrophota bacterium]
MKRFAWILAVLMVCFAAPAFAAWYNPVDWLKSLLSSGGYTVLAYILTALLSLAVFGTVAAVKIVKTLKEVGEFLIVLGDALSDRKVTPEEIKAIIADVRDVVNIWKATPEAYKPPEG